MDKLCDLNSQMKILKITDLCYNKYNSFIIAIKGRHLTEHNQAIIKVAFLDKIECDEFCKYKSPDMNDTTFQLLDIKKSAPYVSDLSIVITEIPLNTTETRLRKLFFKFGNI